MESKKLKELINNILDDIMTLKFYLKKDLNKDEVKHDNTINNNIH